MSLSDEYRCAVKTGSVPFWPNASVHAVMPNADATICGKVEALDVTYTKVRTNVTCPDCLKALKRERQRRSREGQARAAERRAQQADDEAHERVMLAERLADALYNRGWADRSEPCGQDPRGCDEWQAVVDAITGAAP
jgi:hypothetical protein